MSPTHFERDYANCFCGAGEEAYCTALGEPGCRCMAPMMEVEDEVKAFHVKHGFSDAIAEAEARRLVGAK